jgi:hypothetical protein
MATKSKRARKASKASKPVEWSNPEIMLFAGDEQLPLGAIEQHGLADVAGQIFGRKREEVQAEWQKIVNQISTLIDSASPLIKDFTFDEITFQLGFSAEGHIVFVAKAGVQTTISAKFKRKP